MSEFEKYRATLTTVNLLMSANCCRHAFDYQQSEIDQLKAKLNTANLFRKGDGNTIENATKVMNEMREQIQKLQKERDQLKAEKAGLEKRLKAVDEIMNDYYTGSFEDAPELAGWISTALRGERE